MAPIAKASAKPKKKANGYERPAEIVLGTKIKDTRSREWIVGPTIGSGGFGDIYSCGQATGAVSRKVDDYPHVVKIEPQANGPLFVEMHFFLRNLKQEDIDKFRTSKGWKHLGIPHIIANGLHDVDSVRHRFLIMPRYGSDVWKLFLNNNRILPAHTVFRIAIQMLHVLEYIHSRGYVHKDLKGANILLGSSSGSSGTEHCYLVDFGLACQYTTKEFKPNPKCAHNGTIEYTSRDAHLGVPTMRSDLEILGYNLIHWLGLGLPWDTPALLGNPKKVQDAKEAYMANLDKSLSATKGTPDAVKSFMKYVVGMEYDQQPDYGKCQGFMEKGLKSLGKDNKGKLEFAEKATSAKKSAAKSPRKRLREESSVDEAASTPVQSPKGHRRKAAAAAAAAIAESSPILIDDSPVTTPQSDAAAGSRSRREGRSGKLIVNNNITPRANATKKAKKTYELNFELDVSLDADVVLNVRRKKKSATEADAVPSADKKKRSAKGTTTPRTPVSPERKRIARVVKLTPSGTVRVEKKK